MALACLSNGPFLVESKAFGALRHKTQFRRGVVMERFVRKVMNEKAQGSDVLKFDPSRPVKAGDLQKLESEFVKAMQSFYYEGACNMSEVEFLTLQEELLWSGSQVAILSDTEKYYLDGCWAKQEGAPIMTDAEFADVCEQLKKQGSPIVAPRKKQPGLSVSPGLMLAALAGLGLAVGIYATSMKGDVEADIKSAQTAAATAPKSADSGPISFDFLRNKNQTVALQSALAEAQAKLADAEKRVESMQSRLEEGRSQIDTLESSIATLAKEKAQLEGTQKEQDAYLVTLNNQLGALETQAEKQRLMLQTLTGPDGRMAELRAKMEAADNEVQRLKAQEAETRAAQKEELARLLREKESQTARTMEDLSKLRFEKESLAAKVEQETRRYRTEREELEAQSERLKEEARQRELALLQERDAIKATADRQSKLLEIISAPDGKITALKSEVQRAELTATKLREEMAQLQASLEAESASYATSEKKISDLETKVQAATADATLKAQQKAAVINEINAKVAEKKREKAALDASLKAAAEAEAAKQKAAELAAAEASRPPPPPPPAEAPPPSSAPPAPAEATPGRIIR